MSLCTWTDLFVFMCSVICMLFNLSYYCTFVFKAVSKNSRQSLEMFCGLWFIGSNVCNMKPGDPFSGHMRSTKHNQQSCVCVITSTQPPHFLFQTEQIVGLISNSRFMKQRNPN